MDIGVTLPMRPFDGEELVRWARAVEDGPFATMSSGERLCFENHDALIAQAVLAGATTRLKLTTGVNVLPVHREVIFAKQCASLERLSMGRFRLGIGVGSRPDDFVVARAEWDGRGDLFERQLETMRRVWQGLPPWDGAAPVGPPTIRPGGPEIHIGGFSPKALRRCGRLADGLRTFDFAPDPSIHLARFDTVLSAWEAAGRPGRPRLIASTYFALGPDARQVYEDSMRPYYGYEESMHQWALEPTALVTPEAIVTAIKRFEDAGIDEMVFTASSLLGVDAIHRLADAVATARP
jgi:alkanesulfonate monooxygenase SsuD/methylene tetrahydromethanopterin reductase-like flavin-dependent oxidoreductase (luciferase family)